MGDSGIKTRTAILSVVSNSVLILLKVIAGILSGLIRKKAKVDINYLNYLLTNPIKYQGYFPVGKGGK